MKFLPYHSLSELLLSYSPIGNSIDSLTVNNIHFPRTKILKIYHTKNYNLQYLSCIKSSVNNQHLPTVIAVLITSEPRKLLLFHSHLMLQIETRLLAFTDHAYNIKNEEASFL